MSRLVDVSTIRAKEIREARKAWARTYTRAEAAEVMGVTRPTYRKIESGEGCVRLRESQCKRLAAYLGVDESSLFLDSEES